MGVPFSEEKKRGRGLVGPWREDQSAQPGWSEVVEGGYPAEVYA